MLRTPLLALALALPALPALAAEYGPAAIRPIAPIEGSFAVEFRVSGADPFRYVVCLAAAEVAAHHGAELTFLLRADFGAMETGGGHAGSVPIRVTDEVEGGPVPEEEMAGTILAGCAAENIPTDAERLVD
ncbi:MAG: hypothetical protein AAFW69_04690 [Pseudomonadota bacterium]